ncbi:hypothetical protein [Streptomyces harbinensis]|uniref:hypothetical protein n=1 Tax=Streptomyces harbinensis TaxID=1176198 RepID=UPI0036B483EB
MSAEFTARDLRALADTLDALGAMTASTGVAVEGYSASHITLNDEVMEVRRCASDDKAEYRVVLGD